MRGTFLLAAALIAGCGRDTGAVAGPAADAAFCDTLRQLVAASESDFAGLRTGERSAVMPSWESSVTFRGADTCRVAQEDPVSFGSVFCVLARDRDRPAVRRSFERTTAAAQSCLAGWTATPGETVGSRWVDLSPATVTAGERRLLVSVRLVDAPAYETASVTIDVTVRKASAGVATPTPTPP